jgi:uncharacterized phiE125 gp8 family phage protein
MALNLISGPASEPLFIEEVKQHLHVDSEEQDALLFALIAAARQHLDGETGYLGRSLITQTWELTLDHFPFGENPIYLPLPPIQSISQITYIDPAGVTQTLASNKYQLSADKTWLPSVRPAYAEYWPTTRNQKDAVQVRFVAGYGDSNDIPGPLKVGMLLLIGHYFANREAVIAGISAAELPMGADALFSPYRVLP